MIKSLGWLQSFKLTDYLTIFSALVGILNLSIGTQIFSRLLFGLVVGINTIIIPTYLTSVLPGSMGGPAGTLNQLFITIGIFFGFFMSFLVIHDTPTDFAWRLLIGLPILPALIRLHTSQNVYP
jgi:SP family myo-inositol transporter-like MFS transporter 13